MSAGEAIVLTPLRDVALRDRSFLALSEEPWLAIEAPALLAAAGGFVEITYRASHWDEPVRPVFRFHLADEVAVDHIAPGPVAGAGVWIGRVPPGTLRASVSPTSRPGLFGFRVETVRRRAWISLIAAGSRTNFRSTRSAVLTRLIGWKPESDTNLAWATGSTPLAAFPRWSNSRSRPVELNGMDAPRFDWASAPPIHLYIDARGEASGLRETLASLDRQVFPRWTASVLDGEDRCLAALQLDQPGTSEASLVGALRAGDRLEPHALACVGEAAHRHPSSVLFYGDEGRASSSGVRPAFKPGWGPLLQVQMPAVFGGAAFVRASLLGSGEDLDAFITRGALPRHLATASGSAAVVALRRVLLRTRDARDELVVPLAPVASAGASAAIVIPTRDQPARLRRVIDSIHRFSGPVPYAIVVVDNGSVDPETKRLLQALRLDSRVQVLERPGPFNFSRMCNDGAQAAGRADVLVFLNDDTEVLSEGWLDRLASWALRPATGAVGAKLTYPDGRLQHIGVVLGMGGGAGHFGAFAAADAPGWAGRNQVAHEVSAVTGACLAVAREKFEAVDGFDAVNLPVELSDIDLCLKLAEQGWTSMVDPLVHLRHDESASRGGATFRRSSVYGAQRAYFQRRWLARLRDDPYFHPGLSLFKWEAALA